MKFLLPGILVMFFVIVVGAGAFLLGKQAVKPNTITPTPTISESDTKNVDTSQNQDLTPTKTEEKTITAGGVLSFPKYTVSLPEGWASEREQGQDMDKLTLSKLGYKITISEGAFGGSGCLYPGDPPSEMAQTFTSFVEINNPNGFVFRRGGGELFNGQRGWTVCQKGSEGSFGAPTIFGHVNISGPATTNAEILAEIDSIFASIKK
jgi:hypothetical protein